MVRVLIFGSEGGLGPVLGSLGSAHASLRSLRSLRSAFSSLQKSKSAVRLLLQPCGAQLLRK